MKKTNYESQQKHSMRFQFLAIPQAWYILMLNEKKAKKQAKNPTN